MLVEREQKHWDATWARTTDSAGWLNKTKLAFRMLHTSQLGRAYIQLQKEYRLGDSFTPFVAHVMSYSSEIKVVYRHCSFSHNEFIPDLITWDSLIQCCGRNVFTSNLQNLLYERKPCFDPKA
jgi:hypothetical protein